LANKLIDKNKINEEPGNNRTANGRGVGSTDSLDKAYLTNTFLKYLIILSLNTQT